jgi:hypothetical protein
MTALTPPHLRPRPSGTGSSLARRLKRWALVGGGGLVVVLGILVAPLPGPGGVPVVTLGLVLILRGSYRAKRIFIRAHHRWPRTLSPIRRLLGRNPPFAQVIWQQMLRVERLVAGKGRHVFAGLRKGLKPKRSASRGPCTA